ncbi:MAG: endonuclease/exonuclease/phosphatase family protein [Pseudomonadota bacterium]
MAPPVVDDAGRDGGGVDVPGSDAAVVDAADAGRVPDAARPDISIGLDAVGLAGMLEIAAWNVQDFPRNGDTTVQKLAGAVHDMQLDLIAVEEIANMRDFQRVLDKLPEYSGVLCTDTYSNGSYQKTGLIYRSSQIAVSNAQELFDPDWYPFPRSPLQAEVTATDPQGGGSYSFTIIVVHLKAGTTTDDHQRRLEAMQQLKEHIDSLRTLSPDRDVVLLGDFNAQLTGSWSDVWDPFRDDSAHYRILTQPLANAGEWSLPAYEILIDHLVVADNGGADFSSDSTRVLHIDERVSNYTNDLSDHRPVVTLIEPLVWR